MGVYSGSGDGGVDMFIVGVVMGGVGMSREGVVMGGVGMSIVKGWWM